MKQFEAFYLYRIPDVAKMLQNVKGDTSESLYLLDFTSGKGT